MSHVKFSMTIVEVRIETNDPQLMAATLAAAAGLFAAATQLRRVSQETPPPKRRRTKRTPGEVKPRIEEV